MPCVHGYLSVRDCCQARHHRHMARKAAEPALHAADSVWGIPSHVEGRFPDTDTGATPTENLGIRRQYHKRLLLGA
jgi:hypothetical protein